MKKNIITLIFALAGLIVEAQIPTGYYDTANDKSGEELKTALHEIIKDHTSVSYGNIWTAFWSTDNKGDGVVWDMYSDGANYTYYYIDGNDQCGSYEQEGDCYNREHAWPQSWFSEQTTPSCDLHHVFPTDGYVNMQRGNNPFGEVQTASWTSQNGSKLGTCKSALGYTGTVFEPIDEYKGDFARALMYMSVRYYTEDDSWGSSGMTNKAEILPWALQMLLDWSDNDPVSQKEIDRNNMIYNDYQHNRNPFIDHPEYARMIWDENWHEGIGGYAKVTQTDEITDGDYLIVYEGGSLAFNGGLATLDAIGNTIDVSIFANNIESNSTTDGAAFTITSKTGGYSIRSASGWYIGNTSDANNLKTSTTDSYVNTITISADGNADIVSSASHLRFNAASNQNRFRYYKSGTYTDQKAIQLYKKIAVYSISIATVENGTISADAETAVEGAIVTLTATPDAGYDLDHWTVTDATGGLVAVTGNQFEMPASNVTVSAEFVYAGTPFTQQYYLVTSADQLEAGRTYLIVNLDNAKAMGSTSSNGNNRLAADVSISNDVISTIGTDVCELTLGGSTGAWTFFDANWGTNGGYLYAASSSSNYLKTQATNNANGQWSISITTAGVANLTSQGTNTRNQLKYNSQSGLFSCYASGQQDVCLFIRSEEFDITENTTEAHIFAFDRHTVRNGATLTVTGTATCTDPMNLIIEDGAQFIHHSGTVQATMKKNIHAYTDDGGWYTIAVPFADYNPAATLTTDNYDLYAYDEVGDAQNMEWLNYKSGAFNLSAGQGYLYAHNPATTLRMNGILNNGDYTETANLSYANGDSDIKGFNLLGNPTAHDITFGKTDEVSDGYYYLDNGDAWTYTTGNTVPAGRGFLVKANAANQSVTLNPQTRGTTEEGQYLSIAIGDAKAYVKLNEGVSMPLLDLNGRHGNLYLHHDQSDYVMLVRDGAAAIDLFFEPQHFGQHTLSVDLTGLDLDYLHLIDNMTGTDVDLLSPAGFPLSKGGQGRFNEPRQAEYTFTATTKDYPSRFRLVFAPSTDPSTSSGDFAYVSNGEIRLVETQNFASLQIIDMMGRVILCRDGVHTVSTSGMPAGVYVLRIISGDNMKTQKIVIR